MPRGRPFSLATRFQDTIYTTKRRACHLSLNARVVPGALGLKWLHPSTPRLHSSETWVPVLARNQISIY
jgi:hypothetical protein